MRRLLRVCSLAGALCSPADSSAAAPALVLACYNNQYHGVEPYMVWYDTVTGDGGRIDEPTPSPLCGRYNSSFTVFSASTPLKDGRVVALLRRQDLNNLLLMVRVSTQRNGSGYEVKVSGPIWSRDVGYGLPSFSVGVMGERVLGISSLGGDSAYGEINLTDGDWTSIAPLNANVSGLSGVFLGSTFYSAGAIPGAPRDSLQVAGYDFNAGTYASGCSFKVPGISGTYPSDTHYDGLFATASKRGSGLIISGDMYPLLLTLGGEQCGVEAIGALQKRNYYAEHARALLTVPSSGHSALLIDDELCDGGLLLDVVTGEQAACTKDFAATCDVNDGFINLQALIGQAGD